mmetsp:Transcript_8654/g.24730  ORF Transcript_8654/g.24730 Transcript_8654/m.24730 type:complete len:317 (-) Transcript_8654:523-1473(-)
MFFKSSSSTSLRETSEQFDRKLSRLTSPKKTKSRGSTAAAVAFAPRVSFCMPLIALLLGANTVTFPRLERRSCRPAPFAASRKVLRPRFFAKASKLSAPSCLHWYLKGMTSLFTTSSSPLHAATFSSRIKVSWSIRSHSDPELEPPASVDRGRRVLPAVTFKVVPASVSSLSLTFEEFRASPSSPSVSTRWFAMTSLMNGLESRLSTVVLKAFAALSNASFVGARTVYFLLRPSMSSFKLVTSRALANVVRFFSLAIARMSLESGFWQKGSYSCGWRTSSPPLPMFSGHSTGLHEVEITPPPWFPISPNPQKLRSK